MFLYKKFNIILFLNTISQVYESTMMWLKHDLKERLKHMPELIKSIRLSLMSVDYLNSTVQEEDLIQSDITCKLILYCLHF